MSKNESNSLGAKMARKSNGNKPKSKRVRFNIPGDNENEVPSDNRTQSDRTDYSKETPIAVNEVETPIADKDQSCQLYEYCSNMAASMASLHIAEPEQRSDKSTFHKLPNFTDCRKDLEEVLDKLG